MAITLPNRAIPKHTTTRLERQFQPCLKKPPPPEKPGTASFSPTSLPMDSADRHHGGSQASDSPLAHKSSLKNNSFSSLELKNSSYRESYSSEISHGSLHSAEIGRGIPVHVFGGSDARIYDSTHRAKEDDDDDMSLMSETLAQLGRLNTIKESNAALRLPELTVNTQVENVIPPRLRRRPVSEMLSKPKTDLPNANHRLSLNIADDLDKLMERANTLQTADEPLQLAVLAGSSGSSPIHHSGHSRLDSTLSTDSFQTAGEGGSAASFEYRDDVLATPILLPKRPNADNLEKARQASHQYSTTSGVLRDNTFDQDLDDSIAEQSTFHEDDGSRVASLGVSGVGANPERGPYSPEQHYETLRNLTGGANVEQSYADGASDQVKVERANVDLANVGLAGVNQADVDQANVDQAITQDASNLKIESISGQNTQAPTVHDMLQQPVELVHTPQRTNTNKMLPPAPSSLLARSEGASKQVRDSVYTTESKIDDNEFYDIEDPVLVSKPVRSKSVKESIQVPHRKSTKRKSRRPKARDSSNLQLKPFSYNTLIHLLESVNGTVIGEEFESLNLPIKEKQLIEKIVDSLSRLTLDMVIDENRYEIGMQRLEKAHRVLEGFL